MKKTLLFTCIMLSQCNSHNISDMQLLDQYLMQISMSKYLLFDINTTNINNKKIDDNIQSVYPNFGITKLSTCNKMEYNYNISNMQSLFPNTLVTNIKPYNIKIESTNNTFNSLVYNDIKPIRIQENNKKYIKINLTNKKPLLLNKPKILKNKHKVNMQSRPTSINTIIKQVELKKNIPSGLLNAIGNVESKLHPYAVNYNGSGRCFKNKEDALNFVNDLIKQGITNFSVGCFQLHYQSHRNKFNSVSEMFDPVRNAEYAAKLLNNLHKNNGYNWAKTIKRYHSNNAYLNSRYYSKVTKYLGRAI